MLSNHKYKIVVPYLPLYRLGIYKLLSEDTDINFEFLADDKEINRIQNIPKEYVVNGSIKSKFSKVYGFSIKKLFVSIWQKNVLGSIFNKNIDGIIFSEGIHNISNWVFLLLARLTRKHVLIWGHGYYGNENRIKSLLRILQLKLADDVLLYGERAKQLLIEKKIKSDRLHVIYNSLNYANQIQIINSLDNKDITRKKEDLFDNPNYPTLIFVGRLVSIKRVDLLLEAMKRLKEENFNCNCLIVGDGPLRNNLQSLVANNKLENIVFYGSTYNEEELAVLISLSDLFVSPGNVGLNCIHSLTYGTPVLTHNKFSQQMPEFEAIMVDENGLFFNFDDVFDLKEKIKQWFNNVERNKSEIKKQCREIIDAKYNPNTQLILIKKSIENHYKI